MGSWRVVECNKTVEDGFTYAKTFYKYSAQKRYLFWWVSMYFSNNYDWCCKYVEIHNKNPEIVTVLREWN